MSEPRTKAGRLLSRALDHIDSSEWDYVSDIRAVEDEAWRAAIATRDEALEVHARSPEHFDPAAAPAAPMGLTALSYVCVVLHTHAHPKHPVDACEVFEWFNEQARVLIQHPALGPLLAALAAETTDD